MDRDNRAEIYCDLAKRSLDDKIRTRESARRILNILFQYIQPKSVLDVGCGMGTWLAVAHDMGITDIQGIEGKWLDAAHLEIPQSQILACDLEKGFSLSRRFDLALCLEVGEHLHERAADVLIASLVAHSDVVLFSAAIPFQGGHHHVNEQFLQYWIDRFAKHKYRALDIIRGHLWNDTSVLWYLACNVVVFASETAIAASEKFQHELSVVRPVSIVHPDLYASRIKMATPLNPEMQSILSLISQGGHFHVEKLDGGRIAVRRSTPIAQPKSPGFSEGSPPTRRP